MWRLLGQTSIHCDSITVLSRVPALGKTKLSEYINVNNWQVENVQECFNKKGPHFWKLKALCKQKGIVLVRKWKTGLASQLNPLPVFLLETVCYLDCY